MCLKGKNISTYKILSIILKYPTEQLVKNVSYFLDVLKEESLLTSNTIEKLCLLFDYLFNNDLIKLQEDYVSIFDRQKSFSLYLFEHIYGDSNDRGQAMVDLKNIYLASNLGLVSTELPDFIPLFLEYLSLLSVDESSKLLSEPINIFSILGKRLKQINSFYWVVFSALEELSFSKADRVIVNNALKVSKKSFKLADEEEIDNDWTEKSVF